MSRTHEFLIRAQNSDGGWGYRVGGMSFVEPTAAAILALERDAKYADVVQRARGWLTALQRADGGWGIAAPDNESGWTTGWAVRALAGTDSAAAQRGVEWLLAAHGIRLTNAEDVETVERVLKIDATVTGWAWQPGDAAWVFPTALALLALDEMGIREHARVREGIRYLRDRAIPTGGWNIGNPYMVSGNLPATVENTAMALMALRAHGVNDEIVRRARGFMAQGDFTPTAFEWSWRALEQHNAGESNEPAARALGKLQRADGSFDGNPFTTAVAALSIE